MPTFAHIENHVVSNLIIADTLEQAESVIGVGNLFLVQDDESFPIYSTLDDKQKVKIEKARADRQAKLDAEAKAIADAEAKRLADIEKNRIDEAKPVSILPPVKGKFKSAGDN